MSKQHSTCLPEAPQNLFFCAAVEDGATASSRSSTSKNAASRANCPGTRWPEDPQKGGAKRRREERSGRESSAPRSGSNFFNRDLDMLLLCQQRRVNIFKSFSLCTPATSGFITVASCHYFQISPSPANSANKFARRDRRSPSSGHLSRVPILTSG